MGKPSLIKRRSPRLKKLSLGTICLCLSTTISAAQQSPNNNADAPLADYLKRLSEAQVTPAQTTQSARQPAEQPVEPQPRYQAATQSDINNRFNTVREGAFAVPQERPALPRYGIAQAIPNQNQNLEPLEDINTLVSAPITQQNPNGANIDPTQTGRVRANSSADPARDNADNQNPNRLQRVLQSRRVQPAQALESRTLTPDASPFAATGINAGIWNFRPSITSGIETTTSDNATTTASITSLNLDADANLANATLSLDSQLNLRKSFEDNRDMEITGSANLSGSRNLSKSLQALAGLSFQRSRVSATGDLTTLNTTASETDLNSFSANFGLQNQNAKTQISGNIEISRDMYDDLASSTGLIDQSDRNNTSITATLRLGYETSPALTPFIQMAATRRIMDNKQDANGLEQSGYTFDASVGAALDLGEKLNGEASIGWLRTTFDDAQLEANDAIAINALLNWSPRRNTNFALDLNTTSNSGAGTNTGTSISYATGVTATQQLRDNFALTARFGHTYLDNNAAANENQFNLRAQADYQFNRNLGITGGVEHQITQSDGADDQTATTFSLGITARR